MSLSKEINEVVYKIIGLSMETHRILGPGFPVEFYKKALEIELKEKKLAFEMDKSQEVFYKNVLVGTVEIDFQVENRVIILLRSEVELKDIEVQRMLRYISLTDCSIGLLINFGLIKLQYKRVLPSRPMKEVRKDRFRPMGYREKGKTREGNPIL